MRFDGECLGPKSEGKVDWKLNGSSGGLIQLSFLTCYLSVILIVSRFL